MSRTPLPLLLSLPLLVATSLPCQKKPPSQEELVLLRDKKLGAAFFEHADWITGYDEARARARRSKKLIFGYFSRSYLP